MSNPIVFVRLKPDFAAYLQTIDSKVQNNYDSSGAGKPYILGISLKINGIRYMAPLTSPKEKYEKMEEKTFFRIMQGRNGKQPRVIGIILLNNMIPVLDSEIERVDFNHVDEKYKRLLQKQLRDIKAHHERISQIANSVYEHVTVHKNEYFINLCCNFQKLEYAITQYPNPI